MAGEEQDVLLIVKVEVVHKSPAVTCSSTTSSSPQVCFLRLMKGEAIEEVAHRFCQEHHLDCSNGSRSLLEAHLRRALARIQLGHETGGGGGGGGSDPVKPQPQHLQNSPPHLDPALEPCPHRGSNPPPFTGEDEGRPLADHRQSQTLAAMATGGGSPSWTYGEEDAFMGMDPRTAGTKVMPISSHEVISQSSPSAGERSTSTAEMYSSLPLPPCEVEDELRRKMQDEMRSLFDTTLHLLDHHEAASSSCGAWGRGTHRSNLPLGASSQGQEAMDEGASGGHTEVSPPCMASYTSYHPRLPQRLGEEDIPQLPSQSRLQAKPLPLKEAAQAPCVKVPMSMGTRVESSFPAPPPPSSGSPEDYLSSAIERIQQMKDTVRDTTMSQAQVIDLLDR